MTKLSVIIPTLNEEKNSFLINSLDRYLKYKDIQIIVSDGGSCDATEKICSQYKVLFIKSKTQSRAQRINLGLKSCVGEKVLINHPRSLVSREGIESLLTQKIDEIWGGFSHSFDIYHPLLKFTSWYSNNVRSRVFGIVYLDHCIFFNRHALSTINHIPEVDIFEDTLLSRALFKEYGRPKIVPYKVTTSAIRFQKNGFFVQSLINQYLKIRFHLRADHRQMNELYERKTQLNSNYKEISRKPVFSELEQKK